MLQVFEQLASGNAKEVYATSNAARLLSTWNTGDEGVDLTARDL
jgi:hypothetical protein